jgi:hypothetical protein
LWLGTALFILAYVISSLAIRNDQLAQFVTIGQVTATAFGMLAFGGSAVSCYAQDGKPNADQFAGLGFFLMCLGGNWNGAWTLLYRLAGQPSYIINNDLYGAWRPIFISGVLITVAACNLFGGRVPRPYKIRMSLAWIIAFLAILFLALAKPDLRPTAEWLKGYLEEVRSIGAPVQAKAHRPPPASSADPP